MKKQINNFFFERFFLIFWEKPCFLEICRKLHNIFFKFSRFPLKKALKHFLWKKLKKNKYWKKDRTFFFQRFFRIFEKKPCFWKYLNNYSIFCSGCFVSSLDRYLFFCCWKTKKKILKKYRNFFSAVFQFFEKKTMFFENISKTNQYLVLDNTLPLWWFFKKFHFL